MAHNDKKKIALCWNENQYAGILVSQLEALGYEPTLCKDFSSFKQADWKRMNYIIVLCELQWSLETNSGNFSDLNGIRLVQHLRFDKAVKLPVLFVSLLERRSILQMKDHSEKEIISARALQHAFLDVLSPVEEWTGELDTMRDLTDTELEYSRLYCNPVNMLAKIKHDKTQYSTVPLLLEQMDKIENILSVYDLPVNFINDLNNIKDKLNSTPIDISDIQDEIYALCDRSERKIMGRKGKSEKKKNEKTIHVLYLEDEQNDEIRYFCEVAENNGILIEFVKTRDELFTKIKDDSEIYPVVICDIEIWDQADRNDKNRTLHCLGFSCIKELMESYYGLSRQYYLLSNCSKRLHSAISRDLKVPVLSKDEVFSEGKLNQFIREIREEGIRVLDSLSDTGIDDKVFDYLYRYIKKNYIEGFGSFEEIEEEVTRRALVLIDYFEKEGYKDSNETFHKWEKDDHDNRRSKHTYKPYCNMALYIKNKQYSNRTFISNEKYPKFVSDDYEKSKILIDRDFLFFPSSELEQKDVEMLSRSEANSDIIGDIVKKFITKLILRRLAIYIHKIFSQKLGLKKKITRLTDIYPYLNPHNDKFLRAPLFMTGGIDYKTTVKEKQFFVKYFDTSI